MKPPPFTYHAPTSVDGALSTLAELGEHGKVLAGGQSLIPLMNMRLAAPAHLVDINGIDALDEVATTAAGVRVGAGVRHARLEHDATALAAVPLLGQALAHVAHPVIRNRGTVVGSIVHADPAGELPAVLAVLDGAVEVAGRDGTREVAARDFFLGPLESDVRPGELAVSAWFPASPPGTGTAFEELARRHGDYALAGVAALVAVTAERAVAAARASFIGVGPVPVTIELTDRLDGGTAGDADWDAAADHARDRLDPTGDVHASAGYRRHLAGVLLARALRSAATRAVATAGGPS